MEEMTAGQPQAPGAGEQAAGQEAALGQAAQLISNTAEGLSMILELTAATRPDIAPRVEKLLADYQAIVEEASLAGPGGGQPEAGGQVPPEVGGGEGVPAGPQGMPRA